MGGATRLGIDFAGGSVTSGSDNVFINGAGAARVGDTIGEHGIGEHDNAVILSGSPTVFINGIPMARAGDVASCGKILSGSDNVFSGE